MTEIIRTEQLSKKQERISKPLATLAELEAQYKTIVFQKEDTLIQQESDLNA